jgi:hypothetical protein
MLPLNPPPCAREPGYPTRQHLFGDAVLRRHALAILAGAALSGCTGQALPPTSTSGAPLGSQPQVQTPADPASPQPEPRSLPGEAVAMPLGGISAIPEPEPEPVPEPSSIKGDVAPVELPEALPGMILGARTPMRVEEPVEPLTPDSDV